MKLFVLFAAALLGVQAVRVPYVVTDADGEKYQVLLPKNRQGPVYNHPAYDYKPNDYDVYLSPLDGEEVSLQRGRDSRRRAANDYSAEDYHWPPYKQDVVSAARRADSAKQSDSDSSEDDERKPKRRGNARREQSYETALSENANDENDEDEYSLILPHALQKPVHVPGFGVVKPTAAKKVKVKVPHYADAFLRQQIIEQYLASQGLNPEGFDVRGLVARGPHVEEEREERGWDLQYADNQQPRTKKFPRPINLQQLMYVTVPERKRRHTVDVSTTTNPNDITTVPDVTETSTITEATTLTELPESVTVTTDIPLATTTTVPNIVPTEVTPSISVITSTPSILLPPEPEPELLIPLFGYGFGSILPGEVSHVPFVPRIPLSSAVTTSSTTELPAEAVSPVNAGKPVPIHSRAARAVPFVDKVRTQLTKVTPVPPLPNTVVLGPKINDLTHTRTMRAVSAAPVTPAVTEVNAGVVAAKTKRPDVNCDIQCTKFELDPVCAFNGECYHEFANQCAMETFICKRPDLGFTAAPRERCVMHWLKRCSSQDLKIV